MPQLLPWSAIRYRKPQKRLVEPDGQSVLLFNNLWIAASDGPKPPDRQLHSPRLSSVMLGLGISANTLLFETFPAPTSTSKTRICDGLSGPSVKPVSMT
jgi:hypothetical protein